MVDTPKISTEELERNYDRVDPWGYQRDPADRDRKARILACIDGIRDLGQTFERALDIACGEAWITKDLPAKEIWGCEISGQARSRWPANIKSHPLVEYAPGLNFDLVLITGALYRHYDWRLFVNLANEVATKFIVTCNIDEWEVDEARELLKGEVIWLERFPYQRPEKDYVQRLTVYKVTP